LRNGTLVGVNAVVQLTDSNGNVTDELDFNGTTVQEGVNTAALALDGADTQETFTLPDGTVGAISYDTPYDQIDPSQASQSLLRTVSAPRSSFPSHSRCRSSNCTTWPTCHGWKANRVGSRSKTAFARSKLRV
jgi:hypothetical protein